MRKLDLSGHRYGRLTVIEPAENIGSHTAWFCQCKCGKMTVVRTNDLRMGHIKSCGCLLRETTIRRLTKHGLTRIAGQKTHLYRVWESMRWRCFNKSSTDYIHYGARGISICEAWNDYLVFHYWALANRYRAGLTIERIDNDLGYSPENCRFATRKEQARNKRSNRHLTLNSETHILVEWLERLNLSKSTFQSRLHRGWSAEKALTLPVLK